MTFREYHNQLEILKEDKISKINHINDIEILKKMKKKPEYKDYIKDIDERIEELSSNSEKPEAETNSKTLSPEKKDVATDWEYINQLTKKIEVNVPSIGTTKDDIKAAEENASKDENQTNLISIYFLIRIALEKTPTTTKKNNYVGQENAITIKIKDKNIMLSRYSSNNTDGNVLSISNEYSNDPDVRNFIDKIKNITHIKIAGNTRKLHDYVDEYFNLNYHNKNIDVNQSTFDKIKQDVKNGKVWNKAERTGAGDVLKPKAGDVLKQKVGDESEPKIGDESEPKVGDESETKTNATSERRSSRNPSDPNQIRVFDLSSHSSKEEIENAILNTFGDDDGSGELGYVFELGIERAKKAQNKIQNKDKANSKRREDIVKNSERLQLNGYNNYSPVFEEIKTNPLLKEEYKILSERINPNSKFARKSWDNALGGDYDSETGERTGDLSGSLNKYRIKMLGKARKAIAEIDDKVTGVFERADAIKKLKKIASTYSANFYNKVTSLIKRNDYNLVGELVQSGKDLKAKATEELDKEFDNSSYGVVRKAEEGEILASITKENINKLKDDDKVIVSYLCQHIPLIRSDTLGNGDSTKRLMNIISSNFYPKIRKDLLPHYLKKIEEVAKKEGLSDFLKLGMPQDQESDKRFAKAMGLDKEKLDNAKEEAKVNAEKEKENVNAEKEKDEDTSKDPNKENVRGETISTKEEFKEKIKEAINNKNINELKKLEETLNNMKYISSRDRRELKNDLDAAVSSIGIADYDRSLNNIKSESSNTNKINSLKEAIGKIKDILIKFRSGKDDRDRKYISSALKTISKEDQEGKIIKMMNLSGEDSKKLVQFINNNSSMNLQFNSDYKALPGNGVDAKSLPAPKPSPLENEVNTRNYKAVDLVNDVIKSKDLDTNKKLELLKTIIIRNNTGKYRKGEGIGDSTKKEIRNFIDSEKANISEDQRNLFFFLLRKKDKDDKTMSDNLHNYKWNDGKFYVTDNDNSNSNANANANANANTKENDVQNNKAKNSILSFFDNIKKKALQNKLINVQNKIDNGQSNSKNIEKFANLQDRMKQRNSVATFEENFLLEIPLLEDDDQEVQVRSADAEKAVLMALSMDQQTSAQGKQWIVDNMYKGNPEAGKLVDEFIKKNTKDRAKADQALRGKNQKVAPSPNGNPVGQQNNNTPATGTAPAISTINPAAPTTGAAPTTQVTGTTNNQQQTGINPQAPATPQQATVTTGQADGLPARLTRKLIRRKIGM